MDGETEKEDSGRANTKAVSNGQTTANVNKGHYLNVYEINDHLNTGP